METLRFSRFCKDLTGVYAAFNDIPGGRVTSAHNHDFYEIFCVVRGAVTHTVNGREQTLGVGDTVLIRPDDCHFFRGETGALNARLGNVAFTPQVFRGVSLLFGAERMRALTADAVPPVRRLGAAAAARYEADMARIFGLDRGRLLWETELKAHILRLIASCLEAEAHRELPDWLSELLGRMENPENFAAGLQRLYELSGRSPEHVTRQFRRRLGVTPTAYLNRLRINYAKNRLALTDEPVIQIGLDAGFATEGYFYRVFHTLTGSTPAAYRSERRQKIT